MITASSGSSSIPPLFFSLSKILSGDIDCSSLCLEEHSVDGSPYSVRPQAVIYPKTTTDIKHAISFAHEYQIPLTCAGGMTASSGGSLGEGMILDMTRYFSSIKNMNTMEHTVTVGAGVTIDSLRKKLDEWNMELPLLQEERSDATVGGLIATKSATPSTFYTGTVREWIEAVTVVVDSGEEHVIKDGINPSGRLLGIYQSVFPLLSENAPIIRAARREQGDDATGYSLWTMSIGPRQLLDQIVGSEGTLAVITGVTFRLIQKKRHSETILVPIRELKLIETTIAIAKHHRAESLFLFDNSFRTLTDILHPHLLNETMDRYPYFLIITLRDDDGGTLVHRLHALKKVLPIDISYILDAKKASIISSHSFRHSLFTSYSKGAHKVATSAEGIIVPLSSYGECIEALDTKLGQSGRLYTITGFAGSGHIALTASFDTHSLAYEFDLQSYREDVFSIVQTWKGGLSAIGGDGLERTSSLPYVFNEKARDLFKKLKLAWDPSSVFNPSKKIYISKDYLMKHTSRIA